MKRALFLCAVTASVVLAACEAPVTEPAMQIERLASVNLSDEGQRKYQEFREIATVYSAMYVTTDGVGGGRAWGRLSLEESKQLALEQCRKFNSGRSCILYAVAVPTNE
ncbi:hypothetical protein [Tateyamaria omphalii]|uniref:hypothetical protein n=1 Tax=Tateyamaria omphalii TaxID=299262 RepID=UPI0012F81EFE|nr:hypothetical protein [Tateyamaria omphalii]